MNEGTALLQFKSKPIISKSLSETEAVAQFITISDSDKCTKCSSRLMRAKDVPSGTKIENYFDAPWGKPQVEICVACFDGSIKASQGFY